ncbi:MAG: DNA mismatch repair protein MutS [Saccharofermentanales bacterium]|jgi:DNA mismatch repair protein MutS
MSLTFDNVDIDRLTPMMRQLVEEKKRYPDCLIFFRLGDFYELFFDDALTASRELELALTGRECGLEERAPMCGVPHHAADNYVKRLLSRGYKVAVCDQVEDPATAKGLVERQVVRVLTPGTQTDPQSLIADQFQYLCAIGQFSHAYGLAACDVSSGRFETTEMLSGEAEAELFDELARLNPVEFVVNATFAENRRFQIWIERNERTMTVLPDDVFTLDAARDRGLEFDEGALVWPRASAALLAYLEATQKQMPKHLQKIRPYTVHAFMQLDRATRFNLELTETIRDRKRRGSVLWAIDRTKTAMGGRLLRAWLEQPLIDRSAILGRQRSVEALYDSFMLRTSLQEALTGLYDIERLSGRIASGTVTPRDLVALREALGRLPNVKGLLADVGEAGLTEVADSVHCLTPLYDELCAAIAEDPPTVITEGGIFKRGYDRTMDELFDLNRHGKDTILGMEAREREATGIKNLKVGYNRVFGYYYDVSRGQLDKVPDYFIRKQTLVNSERFITPELKEKEDRILSADQKLKSLEYERFVALRSDVAQHLPELQTTARALARLDVLLSLAETAERNDYHRPDIYDDERLIIRGGRHAVVEQTLPRAGDFVKNDLVLNGDDRRTMILTGPNMSGKSTYMRQAAIIVLLAQMGSFVPAASAEIGIVDRVMTRVGASDDLAGGQSTFMVEMSEVAAILEQATPKSFLILDEIGRGTGTIDGLAIAWAVIEFIADRKLLGARALFATHYHELIALGKELDGVFNEHVDVAEQDGDIVFLHEIRPGGAGDSYGIDVAALAGVPASVVDRAREIMAQLESSGQRRRNVVRRAARPMDGQQDLFSGAQSVKLADEIVERLDTADVDNMRPVEAFGLLIDLKQLARRHRRQTGTDDEREHEHGND